MSDELETRCRALAVDLGLAAEGESSEVTPLTGGVASDIAMVRVGDRKFCIKFALPKLKVAADWQAPVHRNAAEYAWLSVASRISPEGAVALLGRSKTLHGFAMEYLDGADVYEWKAALLAGKAPRGEARQVGDLVGRIHAASTAAVFDRSPFQNRDDFRALRIEPYLLFTAEQVPEVAGPLTDLADMLYAGDKVLTHGDVSPKNILFRTGGPILLDAECATMGDASFDPAFCLNHLVLKAIHLPALRAALLDEARSFWSAYAARISWEDPAVLEARICRLLPALMLARVAGKSPVEYLTETEKRLVRGLSIQLIEAPADSLNTLIGHVADAMKE